MKSDLASGLPIKAALESFLNPTIKSYCFSFLFGILFIFFIAELLPDLWKGEDFWTLRRVRENTALEMYAEDIWRNDKSTLLTFDPQSCEVTPMKKWWGKWLEVSCVSGDDQGHKWRYTALYGISSHHLTTLFPALRNDQPVREMKQIK